MAIENQVDSRIGALGLVFDASFDRIKGFWPHVIHIEKELEEALKDVRRLQKKHNASRITIRCLIRTGLIERTLESLSQNQIRLEAQKELSDPWLGFSLIYLGWNQINRRSSLESVKSFNNLLSEIKKLPPKNMESYFLNLNKNEIYLQSMDSKISHEDKTQILSTFQKSLPGSQFSLERNIEKMLSFSDRFQFIVARKKTDKKILALILLESMLVVFDNDKRGFKMLEISCSVKDWGEAGLKGIAAPLQAIALLRASELQSDFTYGEARAANAAINRICYSMGMLWSGRLEKHIITDGPQDVDERQLDIHTPYRDLNVWSFNRKENDQFKSSVLSILKKLPGLYESI